MKHKKRKKNTFLLLFLIFFFLPNFLYFWKDIQVSNEAQKNMKKVKECLVSDLSFSSAVLETKKQELAAYLKNYKVFIKYEELLTSYGYGYQEDVSLYGASLIKLVDAIYLLDNAVDLDTTLVYKNSDYRKYSLKMKEYQFGAAVSLRNLIEYALSVSDNSAHVMLINYIGFKNLQNYGKSLGATAILSGGDLYGNQTASDAILYLHKAYELINNNKNGELLKNSMLNDYKAALNVKELKVAHKYGSYDIYYHDIGIVLEKRPYLIAVLTKEKKNNYQEIINNISLHINELHDLYWQEKENYCNSLI